MRTRVGAKKEIRRERERENTKEKNETPTVKECSRKETSKRHNGDTKEAGEESEVSWKLTEDYFRSHPSRLIKLRKELPSKLSISKHWQSFGATGPLPQY